MSELTPGVIPGGVERDSQWIRQAFFFTNWEGEAVGDRDASTRGARYSSAEIKYTDTTIGGNFSINARPQFTRYADPKMPSLSTQGKGMGEYYSEAIDDNAQRIHLQFGVPEYNSLTRFFGNFYDTSVGHLTNTGDARGIMFGLGKAAGFLLTLPFQAILGISNLITRVIALASGKPYSKYYFLKPTMPLYWSAVSTMVNRIGVNMGLIEGPAPDNIKEATSTEIKSLKEQMKNGLTYGDGLNSDEMAVLNSLLPDVMKADGGIDVYAISNRSQRLANSHQAAMKKIADNAAGSDYETYADSLDKYLSRKMQAPPPISYDIESSSEGKANLPDYLKNYYQKGEIGKGKGADNLLADVSNDGSGANTGAAVESQDKVAATSAANSSVDTVRSWDTDEDYLAAELRDGSAFVTYSVDHEGPMSESFSNSAKSSDIESKMNGMSSQGRSARFSLANGNLGDGAIAQTVEGFMTSLQGVVSGLADSVGLSGLSALGGAAYVDIPDFWDSASASLPKSNYTIKLATPYGNKLSIMTNIYIPLCTLLAGALPRSTGKNSYTSPFLCRLHSQGRNIIKLGMIDSISITRGTGGIGWSVDGLPTAVDVSFSILNLNKIMHVPVTDMAGPTDFASLSMFDEDTALSDYMAVLGGLSLYDQYYFTPRLKIAWKKQLADMNSWMRPTQWASSFAGSGAGKMVSAVYRAGNR